MGTRALFAFSTKKERKKERVRPDVRVLQRVKKVLFGWSKRKKEKKRKEKRKVSTTTRIWDWTKSSSSSSSTLYTNSKKKKKKRKREINGAFDVSCTTTTRETNLPRRDATSRGSGRKPRE